MASVSVTLEKKGIPISGSRDHNFFFVLYSADHEILNARKYKSIKKFSIFQAQIRLERYFSCS